MNEKATIISEALKNIFQSIEELRKAFKPKKFTIDGRLVGDIGEIIASLDYDIELFSKQHPDYDGKTTDGKERKVQIKATFKDSLTFKKTPDYYLGLKLYKDGTSEEIFNGPGCIIYEEYKDRDGIEEKLLSFPISKLKELSKSVSDSDRICKR